MTTLLIHTVAAGLTLALASGDSKPDSTAIGQTESATPKSLAHGASPPDLCSLLSEEEAEAILGKKFGPPQRQAGGDCWYLREGGASIGDVELILSVLPVQMKSEGEFDAFVAEQVKAMNEKMKKAGMQEYSVQRVGEVGAPAYFVDLGLYVLQGTRILLIGTDRPKAIAIAAKALPRFK
jgi:hypothetical protein